MHPPLNAGHQHIQCAEVMQALKDCHDAHPTLKYLGWCNDEKIKLNMCFRAERLAKASDNREKAKAKRAEVEQKWKEIEAENVD